MPAVLAEFSRCGLPGMPFARLTCLLTTTSTLSSGCAAAYHSPRSHHSSRSYHVTVQTGRRRELGRTGSRIPLQLAQAMMPCVAHVLARGGVPVVGYDLNNDVAGLIAGGTDL